MNEAKFQTLFNKWAEHNMVRTFVAELKFTKKGYLPFSAVKEHQSDFLNICGAGGFAYKIPDLGSRNPFDMFYAYKVNAFVVIMFYKRGQREFIMIPYGKWAHEAAQADTPGARKSLTEERAKKIGKTYLLYDDLKYL